MEVMAQPSFSWCTWDALWERGISYQTFTGCLEQNAIAMTLYLLGMQLMMLAEVRVSATSPYGYLYKSNQSQKTWLGGPISLSFFFFFPDF